ncbi:hypothetical protein IWZ00DRAFT_503552, partial [Phyllosticta capitalensis]
MKRRDDGLVSFSFFLLFPSECILLTSLLPPPSPLFLSHPPSFLAYSAMACTTALALALG